ncbi:hypothetical protein ZEAMMB73_Zm00001d038316 [Zea mays]|jgi:hypothetical protein|uniref:Uncharacterized protein n=1 Tax=Zea mays TaxID=4577 RepID=A0A1D6M5G0_MAIZE|nr:hypothetical protein ZEAMMB73_Zm00001d038316 [Zea mays]
MFPAGAVEAESTAGSCTVAPADTDQLDLEAAEQLIQLSGGDGDGAAAAAAVSESRSADSVKCQRKEKEAAVESRRRSAGRIPPPAAGGKDGNRGSESGVKGVDSSACSATAADVVAEDNKVVVVESCRRGADQRLPAGKDRNGGFVHGEARKRPRFRSLAAIYSDTEPRRLTAGGGERHADRDPHPPEEEEGEKREARRVIAVDAEASKARRSVQLAHRSM